MKVNTEWVPDEVHGSPVVEVVSGFLEDPRVKTEDGRTFVWVSEDYKAEPHLPTIHDGHWEEYI